MALSLKVDKCDVDKCSIARLVLSHCLEYRLGRWTANRAARPKSTIKRPKYAVTAEAAWKALGEMPWPKDECLENSRKRFRSSGGGGSGVANALVHAGVNVPVAFSYNALESSQILCSLVSPSGTSNIPGNL